jgi:tetratricopeptide (TPR) repeat protein
MASRLTILPWTVAIVAIAGVAAWPAYIKHTERAQYVASLPTIAPVTADYELRDKTIAFWEGQVRRGVFDDVISPRQLASEYLQRYRERGDIGDVLRARNQARRALAISPRGNLQADLELATVDLTLHQFHAALAETKFIESYDPNDPQMKIREASLDLEIGNYAAAKRIIDALPAVHTYAAIPRDTLVTRYDELTGHLADARALFESPTAYGNAQFDAPAQQRAWFFFRAGELAFEAGDNDGALADERQSLAIFPNYVDATRAAARFDCALQKWKDCLSNAVASAGVIPYPETLGYEADAQRALGDADGAKQTNDLIRTIERIGNTQHISDRLLAIYYSEHHLYPDDAYLIAKRELAVRDDILTEDTLAWAAAMDGRWNEARTAMRKAIRFDTEMSLMQYHAGAIAEHFGDREEARRRYTRALALNPHFHAVYADDARARLAALRS